MPEPTDAFADLKEPGTPDEYYPGSKQRRRNFKAEAREKKETAKAQLSWDARPIKGALHGKNTEFFLIGALAKALDKKPVTVRRWIELGWLPGARYRTQSIQNTRGNAGRRLWTREQIEMIVRVATEAGILGIGHPDIPGSNFIPRVREEWKKL